jgi:ribosomal protein L7/L12
MDAVYADQIRVELMKRLAAAKASIPTVAVRRAARTMLGVGRGSAVALGLALTSGEGKADVDAISDAIATIGALKGVTMKIGQLLGYIDVGIPESMRIALSVLQTHAQPMPFERVREIVAGELGSAGQELVRGMRKEPIAAASIGQVHACSLGDGTKVVVKVVYPGIEDAISQDFGPATLSGRLAVWVYPKTSLDTFVRDVRARVLEECDYALEAKRQERFRELFAAHPTIVIPEVHRQYSSAHVLTTTFVDGVHLDAWLAGNPDPSARNRAGEALFDFYLGSLFRHGIYNCDPHPGNYLFLRDGRIAFLDFGCAREFDAELVGRIAALTHAMRKDDRNLIYRALLDLGVARPGERFESEPTRWLLRAFYGPLLRDGVVPFDLGRGLSLREVFRRWRYTKGLALPGELVFLLRTSLGLSSVLARIGARANWFHLMEHLLDVQAGIASPTSTAPDRPEPPSRASSAKLEPRVPTPPPRAGSRSQAVARAEAETQASDTGLGVFDVVLIDPGEGQIEVLRQIRDLTGMTLRDAKDLIDDCPKVIKQGVSRGEAVALRVRLETAGAQVEVKPVG